MRIDFNRNMVYLLIEFINGCRKFGLHHEIWVANENLGGRPRR
jgi:hypothetical protein